MAKKKKLTKAERKEARLRKGKQWLLTYTGSPKKMNKHYRERFHVDAVTAAKDLQELGVNYTQEQLDQIKQAEEQRLRQRRMEREAKERERLAELYEDCDDRFAFIAGYTDGGAPFGVMWEEVGIDPGLPFEEKVNLYHMQMLGIIVQTSSAQFATKKRGASPGSSKVHYFKKLLLCSSACRLYPSVARCATFSATRLMSVDIALAICSAVYPYS